MLIVSGCLTLGGGLSKAQPRAQLDRYTLTDQVATSATGCNYRYRLYSPVAARSHTSVILGHGFMRNQNTLIDMSRALANSGIQVVTLNFCNMRFWNGHHQDNATDMRDLAKSLQLDNDVIYAGFSAGALAAVLASDDQTRAIVALDLVDQKELGLNAIVQLDTPLIGLAGDNSSCNAGGRGATLFSARKDTSLSTLIQQEGASHCEFESPSSWLCEVACGDGDTDAVSAATRASIIQQTIKSIGPFLSPLHASIGG